MNDELAESLIAGTGGSACGGLDGLLDFTRLRLIHEAELLNLRAPVLGQLEREILRGVRAFAVDRPVFLGDNRRDLRLALADHAQRGALHAPGSKTLPDFLPEHGREG